jgi:hypothetical protein
MIYEDSQETIREVALVDHCLRQPKFLPISGQEEGSEKMRIFVSSH